MRCAKKLPGKAYSGAGSDVQVVCFWAAPETVPARNAFYDIFDASNPICRLCQRCVLWVQTLASSDAALEATLARRLPASVRAELLDIPPCQGR